MNSRHWLLTTVSCFAVLVLSTPLAAVPIARTPVQLLVSSRFSILRYDGQSGLFVESFDHLYGCPNL